MVCQGLDRPNELDGHREARSSRGVPWLIVEAATSFAALRLGLRGRRLRVVDRSAWIVAFATTGLGILVGHDDSFVNMRQHLLTII